MSLVKVFRLDGNEEQRSREAETIINPLALWFNFKLKILNLYLGPNYPLFIWILFPLHVQGYWFSRHLGFNLRLATTQPSLPAQL